MIQTASVTLSLVTETIYTICVKGALPHPQVTYFNTDHDFYVNLVFLTS